jgi:hypothetical protein
LNVPRCIGCARPHLVHLGVAPSHLLAPPKLIDGGAQQVVEDARAGDGPARYANGLARREKYRFDPA